ncbi:MAG TPA: hypothetical protein VF846_06765 [Thermoanaerobaculia bacterium]|jgi:hypothetical protein
MRGTPRRDGRVAVRFLYDCAAVAGAAFERAAARLTITFAKTIMRRAATGSSIQIVLRLGVAEAEKKVMPNRASLSASDGAEIGRDQLGAKRRASSKPLACSSSLRIA